MHVFKETFCKILLVWCFIKISHLGLRKGKSTKCARPRARK